jgi:beta-glucosidase
MDVRRWIDKVPALLHVWYPGQEGGTAIGEVIFGIQNPEGKLPVSFDRSWEENPSEPYYTGATGADKVEHIGYGDKLMVGYRYWTTTGKHPLFPFGFGLSYTTFSFSHLHLPSSAQAGSIVPVSFDVANTGSTIGAEVAQVYVSDPSAKAARPERELKGFEKVRLNPGETRHVSLDLDARAFSYWDETAHKWTIDPGKFVILVGDSSENTPLHADVTLK